MNFGSRYVYRYDLSDEESVSDEEYGIGMTISDESDSDDGTSLSLAPPVHTSSIGKLEHLAPPLPPRQKSKKSSNEEKISHWRRREENKSKVQKEKQGGKQWRRADTNVISIKFDTLSLPSGMHAGDPTYCTSCEALLSNISKVTKDGEEKIWKCEFCSKRNVVDLEDEEIPKAGDTTFMITPALSTMNSTKEGMDESMVIFCVDTSGSMCVTTAIDGRVNLKGDRLKKLQRELNPRGEQQWIHGHDRNVTYISRLQAVQAAVDDQLDKMNKDHWHRRVSLIKFGNEVTVYGDGKSTPEHIAGEKLKNKDELIAIGNGLDIPKSIRESRRQLGDKIFGLEEGGATALGPALLVAVAAAGKVPGSKVILCTDGMSNVGLGSLDSEKDEELQAASDFFAEVSQMAKDKGVAISVISIKGTVCKLVELGKLADETGGQLNMVDPLKLTEEFGSILEDEIIATNVTAKMILHKGLYFRFEESEDSVVSKTIGNVTRETEVTFEYGVRTKKNKKTKSSSEPEAKEANSKPREGIPEAIYDNPKPGPTQASGDQAQAGPSSGAEAGPLQDEDAVKDLTELPFQLQIKYTDQEGAEALRVISETRPVTSNRQEAEKDINVEVVGTHAAQNAAKFAIDGEYAVSRVDAMMKQRLLHRSTVDDSSKRKAYKKALGGVQQLERGLMMQQRSESSIPEDESFENLYEARSKSSKKRSHFIQRRKDCSDEQAGLVYKLKNSKQKDLFSNLSSKKKSIAKLPAPESPLPPPQATQPSGSKDGASSQGSSATSGDLSAMVVSQAIGGLDMDLNSGTSDTAEQNKKKGTSSDKK